MKTPREILLARHQSVTPKLYAARHAALEDFRPHERSPALRPSLVAQFTKFFRLPKPALAGLALAWSIILLLNLASPEAAPGTTVTTAPMAQLPAAMHEELREQRRLFSELVGTAKEATPEPPRFVPRPRGETKTPYTYV